MNGFIFSKKDNEVLDFFYVKVDFFQIDVKERECGKCQNRKCLGKALFDNGNALERFEHSQDAGY